MKSPDSNIIAFQADDLALEQQAPPAILRATLYTLLSFLILALIWAAWAKLDRVVVALGRIASTRPTLSLAPLEIATVREIKVTVGDRVKAGDVLVTLDSTFATADAEQVIRKAASLSARIARLEAEIAGTDYVPANSSPESALEKSLYDRRQQEYQAKMANFANRLSQLDASRTGKREESASLQKSLKVAKKIEAMRAELVKSEYGSKLTLLQSQSDRLTLEQNLASAETQQREIDQQFKAIEAERATEIANWHRQNIEELTKSRDELAAIQQDVTKAKRRQSLIALTAPEDATVLEIAGKANGAVVQAAETLVTLVPAAGNLLAEIDIPAEDVARVRVGDAVRIKLDAYPFQRHGVITGTLNILAGDAVAVKTGDTAQTGSKNIPPPPQRGQSQSGAVYHGRVALDAIALRAVPTDTRLMPGLTLQAEISIGQRSVLSYLTWPIRKGMDEAMREP